jgi:preprotein translocase subunit SecD
MRRSWWWRAALFGLVTLLACVYLVPTLIPDPARRPAIVRKLNLQKRIRRGLDLAGGLRLVYAVDIDKAVSSKVDQIASALEGNIHTGTPDVAVRRESRDQIIFEFKKAGDIDKLNDDVLADFRDDLDQVGRDEAKGVVRYRLDPDRVAQIKELSLREAIKRINDRVDRFGMTEPNTYRRGSDIVVELPGLEPHEFERIKSIVGRTAQLEFKLVADEATDYMRRVAATLTPGGPISSQTDRWRDPKTGGSYAFIYLEARARAELETFIGSLTGDLAVPDGREFGYEDLSKREGAGGQSSWRAYLLYRRAGVTGDYLTNAEVAFSRDTGAPEVVFSLNRQGGDLMGKLTGNNVGRRMAIVLDDTVTSAPIIQAQINRSGSITLGTSLEPGQLHEEARELAAVLRSGSLPAPLTRTSQYQVGRTLGDDAVAKAELSMAIGAGAVILFMLIYYRLAGLIANIAMILNLLYMLATLAWFEAALTLPGIAGLVLTIGMAVDANIIIYERIREELRAGKSPRAAVDAGFSRAFWTVFDAHVTTFVAGVVLYSYGSGPIRGFAITLLVGIVANLLTSVWISRWMFDFVVHRRRDTATLSI